MLGEIWPKARCGFISGSTITTWYHSLLFDQSAGRFDFYSSQHKEVVVCLPQQKSLEIGFSKVMYQQNALLDLSLFCLSPPPTSLPPSCQCFPSCRPAAERLLVPPSFHKHSKAVTFTAPKFTLGLLVLILFNELTAKLVVFVVSPVGPVSDIQTRHRVYTFRTNTKAELHFSQFRMLIPVGIKPFLKPIV